MKKEMQGNLMLLITALIWGSAFVAQSAGMEYVGPFTYTMARSFIGFLALIPVVLWFRKNRRKNNPMTKEEEKGLNLRSIRGGIFCGLALGIASCIQQVGVSMTTAGKAGFITALYIIIVPILGIFLKKRIPGIIWLCIAIALAGFWLLCIKDGFSVSTGDLFCLLCAFCFSVHIMVIDHFAAQDTDSVMISCVQFLVAGLLSAVLTSVFETPTWNAIWNAKLTILYAGLLSSGVGYTLQITAQRYTKPTVATLLMSLESVFAALFGGLILHEVLSFREFLGCVLVFAAVILAQIPLPAGKKTAAED
ncbi:MAG: DMT family transporter [Lachnospiraceae bacterium]|nr:DMT family transporter [Lachnospiraceae bacterium]